MTRRGGEPPPADALALLAADPDDRPNSLDGLIVNGVDALAQRRRMIRERNAGHPDPEPPPPTTTKEKRTMANGTTVTAPPATPTSRVPFLQASSSGEIRTERPATVASPRSAGVPFQTITPEQFDALPAKGGTRGHRLAPVVAALARGECVSVPVAAEKRESTSASLRALAKRHGMDLEIRSGVDYVAARKVEGITVTRATKEAR